jgi:hypothetical protein
MQLLWRLQPAMNDTSVQILHALLAGCTIC